MRRRRVPEKSAKVLASKINALRVEQDRMGRGVWAECLLTATNRLRKEMLQSNSRGMPSCTKKFCLTCLRVLIILFFILLCIIIFLYLCEPASFFLKRKLHSRLYPVFRLTRKSLLALHPFLSAVGIDVFSSCFLKNPFVQDKKPCTTIQDIKEWSCGVQTLPRHIIKAATNGEWWILRSAIKTDREVTLERLHQFSVDNNGQLPRICQQIVGGGDSSKVTAFYPDIFDIWKMKATLKSPVPWSLSWIECPDEENQLTLNSIFPSLSCIPSDVIISATSLISFSTEWCVHFHYQNDDWPSTLLSLAVVKGEVRAIPVVAEDQDCHGMLHKYWESPILLKEGDAVLLDHQYWHYELQTWSNYSITKVSSLSTSKCK